jgi:hypothetical protein
MPSLAPRTDRDEQSAYVKDVKPANTDGGTFSNGAWRTRDLNTLELSDPSIAWIVLGANQFALLPGTYEIEASAPAVDSNNFHKAKLYDVTHAADIIIGSSESINGGLNVTTRSVIVGVFQVSVTSTFEIQHQIQSTVSGSGFGNASHFGVVEVYTIVKLKKVG